MIKTDTVPYKSENDDGDGNVTAGGVRRGAAYGGVRDSLDEHLECKVITVDDAKLSGIKAARRRRLLALLR